MKNEDLNLILQLIDSIGIATEKIEKALEERDAEKINKSKEEILKFQKQISELIG